ncbi:MAG: D-alanine--D-alanine ligase [Acidobacteria bacterium]|nr:D-alanine--D-alanine ligase [Acidobacteriota bacterium]
MSRNKLRVAIIFGGRSGEHEVSLESAASIIRAIDKRRYQVVPIGITKQGRWLFSHDSTRLLPAEIMTGPNEPVAMLADPTRREMARFGPESHVRWLERIDVVFPVLHGPYGEDGTIQGLLDMADVPYVGCGVLASACGMDKVIMKHLFHEAGLPNVHVVSFLRDRWAEAPARILSRINNELGFPVFVKPANLGSSVGISKAANRAQLIQAIHLAAGYDRKILVEETIVGRELEVSVLGNDEPVASLPGEIIPGDEFYSYDDKYVKHDASLVIPAHLPKKIINELQKLAIRAFQSIDGSGLARVDFFLEAKSHRIIVNEINTMPGFTSISMYPKLWEASGISYPRLIDRLIQLAIERHRDRSRSLTTYKAARPVGSSDRATRRLLR